MQKPTFSIAISLEFSFYFPSHARIPYVNRPLLSEWTRKTIIRLSIGRFLCSRREELRFSFWQPYDVASKIMSFSQQGPRAICILSANGAISNVTLRQSATSGGTLTYEGRFEILSLSGSFLLTENGGTRSRTGGLSVSLAGPDGRVVGGGVAGMLMAASPVQVVVGSFVTNGQKDQARLANAEPCIGLAQAAVSGSPAVAIPISRAAVNETYVGPSSLPSNHNTGATAGNHSAPQSTQNMSSFQPMGWSGSQSIGESRHNTDINIPLPGG